MITIETKPGITLGFYKPPVMPTETETIDRKCLYINNTILHVYYIGKISEVREDQAKKLVSLGKMPLVIEGANGYIDLDEKYEMDKFMGNIPGDQYKFQLKVVAQSVGIEEKDFDQYLVIKL